MQIYEVDTISDAVSIARMLDEVDDNDGDKGGNG